MTVAATITMNLTVSETISLGVPDVNTAVNATVVHDQWNTTKQLTGATTPPVSVTASFQQALTAGAATIDLTALPGTAGATVSANGLKLVALKLQNPVANANPITVKFGAANPYTGLGAAFNVTLQPGQEMEFYAATAAPAVSGSVKNLDLTGTGTQSLNVVVVAG